MLVHTSMRVQIHHQFKELLERERVETLEKLRRRDESLESDLRDFWDAEIEKVDASSDEWDHRQISYVELRGWLDEVLVDSRVIEENATSVDRLNYGEDPETVVVVGGNTVARGLTLEGLVSSFFVRSAGAYDTLLQMGRWFGFRNGYEDLPRIWMTDELNDWFHHLATVEQEIRYDIGRYEAEGLSPLQFGPRLRTHPAIAITAAAKMRDATDAQVSFSGRRIQTILFDHRSKVWLEGNLRAARNLVSASLDYGIEPEDMKNGNWVFRDVRAAAVLDFLRDYQFHKAARELDNARLTSYVRSQLKNRELERWSIVIAGLAGRDDHLDDIELGLPRRINMINRSRMPSSPEYANIKALMSKVDRMLDFGWKEDQIAGVGAGKLASLRNSPEPDSSGRQPGYGDDSGLLVLYPISRHSKAKPGSKRKDLEAVDDVIGVGMVFPEAMTDDGKQDYKTADLSSQVPEELTEDDVLVEDVAPIPKFNS